MVSLQAALMLMALSATGSNQTVLLDFTADWCNPCQTMNPVVAQLAEKGYPVKRVDVDQNRELAQKYQVQNIPCFIMLVDGREVDRVVGGVSLDRLEQMCRLAPPQRTVETAVAVRDALSSPPARSQPIPSTPSPPLFSEKAAQVPPGEASPQWEHATAGWTPRRNRQTAVESSLIAASARLRIEDPNGHSCGSGTVIDAREGEALILTCGHIFRDSAGKGAIEVDLFGPGGERKIPGRLISYDIKRDVGLVAIRVNGPVTTARLAPSGNRPAKGAAVVSVGCNNGSSPSSRRSQITSLDKFLGPPNVQVAGLPVEGRSGGGLFDADGQVIGVCNAADPEDREGLYAALASIYAQLEEAGLSHIVGQSPGAILPASHSEPLPKAPLVAIPPSMPRQMPRQPGWVAPGPAAVASSGLDVREQAALEKIRRRLGEGAEVTCVIRSCTNPQAENEVIVLDHASPEFFRQLAAESRARDGQVLTSVAVPRQDNPTIGRTSPPSPKTVNGWSRSTDDGWHQRR